MNTQIVSDREIELMQILPELEAENQKLAIANYSLKGQLFVEQRICQMLLGTLGILLILGIIGLAIVRSQSYQEGWNAASIKYREQMCRDRFASSVEQYTNCLEEKK